MALALILFLENTLLFICLVVLNRFSKVSTDDASSELKLGRVKLEVRHKPPN